MRERNLTLVAQFLDRHGIGVDDLFFALHLGAKQIATNPNMSPDTRAHWAIIREECHTLWHNIHGSGAYLNQDPQAQSNDDQ